MDQERDRCTSIGVGPKAMKDGSTITTHNNDCQDCDYRITHVPARDWPAGSKRPVSDIRNAYPRYVEDSELNVHGPDYLKSGSYPDATLFHWNTTSLIGYIDQVPHTYAYTLGAYGIQNEKQVSIGESTCSAKFVGRPVYAEGGKALFHMETLTEIALERCDTARCAVTLMGDLAVKHGFYGPEWDGAITNAQDEAGEALTVSDPKETWMFHVMPDDTGASAIWVAQKVPDDHITAVANQFVIGEIDLGKDDFLGSTNIYSVAERNNLWSASSGVPFHWSRVYGNDRGKSAMGCTRRIWRVFTLAAPSLQLSPFTDGLATFGFGPDGRQPYPFSVKPDRPLTVLDIMNMNRDQFEGTPFDLTAGVDAGQFGDPMRFPPLPKYYDSVNGINFDDYNDGVSFERPISLWRTAYSSITQSRADLPNVVGGVTWVAQYAPHHSTFVPVYTSPEKTPHSLNTGNQHKIDKASNWWIHSITGNYLSRWYRYTIVDVRKFQKELEATLFASQAQAEAEAVALATQEGDNAAAAYLQRFHDQTAAQVRDDWWAFFFRMVGVYRDMYRIVNPNIENFNRAYRYVGVQRNWFEQIGFWGYPGAAPPREQAPVPIKRFSFPSEPSLEAYARAYPHGYNASYPYHGPTEFSTLQSENEALAAQLSAAKLSAFVAGVVGAVVGIVLAVLYFRQISKKNGYMPI